MASVINDILTIQKSHVAGVREDVDNAHGGDMLEAIFQDGLHLSSGPIVEERVKAFVDNFLDQAGAFC